MRSPACLIFAVIGLFSFVPTSDAARGGGFAPRPAARVSRVASAPRPVRSSNSVTQTAASVRSSFRALRNEVGHDLRANRSRNRRPIIIASGYYGYDPNYTQPYTPGAYTTPESDQTPTYTSPGGTPTPGAVAPETSQSRDDLDQEQARLQADLEASPGWAAVNADIETSRAAIAAARQQVDQSLAASSEYQVAKAQKSAAEELLATLRSGDHADEAKIWSVAEEKLQASQTMTRLQRQALAADPSFAAANSKLQSAASARNGMVLSIRAQMQNSERY